MAATAIPKDTSFVTPREFATYLAESHHAGRDLLREGARSRAEGELGMSTALPIQGACGYCGQWHSGTCPKVKSIEYHNDGTVKRVEFHEPFSGQRPQPVSCSCPEAGLNPGCPIHGSFAGMPIS